MNKTENHLEYTVFSSVVWSRSFLHHGKSQTSKFITLSCSGHVKWTQQRGKLIILINFFFSSFYRDWYCVLGFQVQPLGFCDAHCVREINIFFNFSNMVRTSEYYFSLKQLSILPVSPLTAWYVPVPCFTTKAHYGNSAVNYFMIVSKYFC